MSSNPPSSAGVSPPRLLFWLPLALLAYAQIGYGLLLAAWGRIADRALAQAPAPAPAPEDTAQLPSVTVIVAAYTEQDVIERRVANLLALDFPRENIEIVVACDGSPDATAERARAAGADHVLELVRCGKVRAQDAGVRAARGDIVAFTDANTTWEPDALRRLVRPFADPEVGYVCGQVRFVNPDGGTNQEGAYWRYEMWLRTRESQLASVTGGNGAIYATRRAAYLIVDPIMGHDLSFPFNMVKRGWRARYAPDALAEERMVPSIEGEFARKRRMMSHTWPIVVRGGLADPRGYPPRYALMIFSHRLLRYTSPFLHLLALGASIGLRRRGRVYRAALNAQFALLVAAAAARARPARPLLIARYYVLTTASPAAGLWDWLRHGTTPGWEAAEGTR